MRLVLPLLIPLLAYGENITGMWDATVVTAGVSVPFHMRLKQTGTTAQGTLFDGKIEYPSDSGAFEGNKLHLHWNITNADLDAVWDGAQLKGTFVTRRSNSKLLTKTISAIRARRPKDEGTPASVAGSWTLRGDDHDPKNIWTITIQQHGADVSGAIQRLDGDSGTLTGRVTGNALVMSHFSGIRPAVLRGDLGTDGLLHLTYNDSLKMTGIRSDAAEKQGVKPVDPHSFTRMKNPDEPFPFSFPDVTGKIVSNTDPRYRGKVVLVNITGSWCPNCNDDAPFLDQLYKKYRPAGLEVVGLSFESGDIDYDRDRVREFIARNKVSYPILIAGTTDNVAEKLPFVENFAAFPTTFFLGRNGKVKSIHDGFSGVSTGAENQRLKAHIEEQVKALLELASMSPAPSAQPVPATEVSGAPNVKRFYRPELDALRFFAFLAVLIHHGPRPPGFTTLVSRAGGYGLSMFFLLSAYLITELLLREREKTGTVSWRLFFTRRALRIWPLYYAALAAAFLIGRIPPHVFQVTPWGVVGMALFVGNWVPRAQLSSLIAPLWSISVEEQFYLIWPPIVKFGGKMLTLTASIMFIACAAVWLAVFSGRGSLLWNDTPVEFLFFAAGVIVALATRGNPAYSMNSWVRAGLLVGGLILLGIATQFGEITDTQTGLTMSNLYIGYGAGVAGCTMIFLAALGVSKIPRALIYLGKISYGLYVVHVGMLLLAMRTTAHFRLPFHSLRNMFLIDMLGLSLSVAAASLSYRWFETPFLKLKARFEVVKSRPV